MNGTFSTCSQYKIVLQFLSQLTYYWTPTGYKPWKVTFSSDNFQQLYNWAVELIKKYLLLLLIIMHVAEVIFLSIYMYPP